MINVRGMLVLGTCALLLYTLPGQAQEKGRKDKNLDLSMACSAECGKQHGNGKRKGDAYDPKGYESCMVNCMHAKQKRGPAGKI